jgi:hypothetical protein
MAIFERFMVVTEMLQEEIPALYPDKQRRTVRQTTVVMIPINSPAGCTPQQEYRFKTLSQEGILALGLQPGVTVKVEFTTTVKSDT